MSARIKSWFTRTERVATAGGFESTAVLAKLATLIAIGVHSLCLLPRYYLFYDSPWLDKSYAGLTEYPVMFRMVESLNNGHLMLFFVVGELVSLLAAFRHRNSPLFLLPVLFFSTNIYHATWAVQDGGNNLTHINLWYLLLAVIPPVGAAAWSKYKLQFAHIATATAVLLMRFQLVVMYLCASVSKLQGEMWQNGTSLFYIYQNEYFGAGWARDSLMQYPALGTLGAYAAIIFQVAFCFLAFNRRYKYWVMATGVFFHLGIALTMNLHLFSLTMALSYAAFVEERHARAILAYVFPADNLVLGVDRDCTACVRVTRVLRLLCVRPEAVSLDSAQDPRDERLAAVNPNLRTAKMVGFAGDRACSGFECLSELVRRTWVGPLIAPFLKLAELTNCGDRIYESVSQLRRATGCGVGACKPKEGV